MTDSKQNHSSIRRVPSYRSLLVLLGVVGSVGLFSGGGAIAQTASAAENAPPSAVDLLPAADPTPQVIAPQPTAPERTERPQRELRPAAAPRPERSAIPSPTVESPTAGQNGVPAAHELLRHVTPEPSPSHYSDLYIDPTRYDVGATRSSPTVVISEQRSGCQTVIQPGQAVPSQLCGGAPRAMGLAQSDRAPGAGPVGSDRRSGEINLGPIRVSARGIGFNAAAIEAFYNRTVRPLAMVGNGNTRLMFPLSTPAMITSMFGWRIHPISGDHRFHYGTDLGAPMGTPVVAAYSGRVETAAFLRGYGLTVVLRHDNGTAQTLYAHLSEIFVQAGEELKQGEVLGRVGSTGNSTGPHLHFEYRKLTPEGWIAIDPGSMLQTALAYFTRPFQVAQATPEAEASKLVLQIKSLQDFGKLASDVKSDLLQAKGSVQ